MQTWLKRVQGWLLVAGLFLGTLVSVYWRGRATGRQTERQERNEQVNDQAANARKEVRDVEQETARMGDDAIADELSRDWVRGAGKGRR